MEGKKGQVTDRPSPRPGGFDSVANFSPGYRALATLCFLLYMPVIIVFNYLVFGLRFEGRENLRRSSGTGRILVSNHSLYLDPAILFHALFPRMGYYLGLKSHFRHPVGGALLRLIGGIPIPGKTEMKTAETTIRRALDRGHDVHLFPEGELTHLNQDIKSFKKGAFYLAVRLGVSVVPLTLVYRPRRLFGRVISPRSE